MRLLGFVLLLGFCGLLVLVGVAFLKGATDPNTKENRFVSLVSGLAFLIYGIGMAVLVTMSYFGWAEVEA